MAHPLNKTLAYEDLELPEIRPTFRSLKSWVRKWCLRGHKLGVNGHSKRRWRVRHQKMWEYSRGLALTKASAPERGESGPLHVLDVGGAMTLPLFYLGDLGDHVVSLDIDEDLVAETNRTAARAKQKVDARTTNLVEEDPSPADLGAPAEGFDRVYCFCVIEHIVPPGQHRVAERMAKLLKPGGQLALTFDYGENARSESPMPDLASVHALRDAIGLPLLGNEEFFDDGRRYPLSRRHPEKPFTFGALFFEKPA
jgi:SAM-dependent methyltransferase